MATDRGRAIGTGGLAGGALPVAADEADLEAAIDVLVDNALTHTPPNAPIRVRVDGDGTLASVVVEDGGPGFDAREAVARGVSHGGSTGLGLDIARRAAEHAGGGMDIGPSPTGGARVRLRFGPAGP